MAWTRKAQQTPLDDCYIHGLHYLDGDVMAIAYRSPYLKGQKYPVVEFPSGFTTDAWETSQSEEGAIIHLFGEMDLPYFQKRDAAYKHAFEIAEACGYAVSKRGDNGLEVRGHDLDEHLLISYDPDTGRMEDVTRIKSSEAPPQHPAHQLMTDDLREAFPKLYENEEIGLEAPALVKYFSPDNNWTWYASEYDGDNIFFGLVIGFEIEYGYSAPWRVALFILGILGTFGGIFFVYAGLTNMTGRGQVEATIVGMALLILMVPVAWTCRPNIEAAKFDAASLAALVAEFGGPPVQTPEDTSRDQ